MGTYRFVFNNLIEKALQNNIRLGSPAAKKFFESEISTMRTPRPGEIFDRIEATDDNLEDKPFQEGDLYLFQYNPKNANNPKKLPYYDKFPVALIFDIKPDHFKALNFHYLHYVDRAIFLEKLRQFQNKESRDSDYRLDNINYDLVKISSSVEYYKGCVKRYLNNHIVGRMIRIHPVEWDLILLMPIERFQGARRNRIFEESRLKYAKRSNG